MAISHEETLSHPFLLLLPLFLFLLFIFHRHNKTTLTKPPGPPPLPIIGNLHNLRVSSFPHISLHLLSQKYGPLFQLYLGQIPTIVISNADNASEILKSQDHIFCNRRQLTSIKRLSYGGKDLVFSYFDDNWKQLRRICNEEIFSLNKVKSFDSIRREEVDVVVKTISRDSSCGKAINLSELLLGFFNNVIFRVVLGKRLSAAGECGSSPLETMLKEWVVHLSEFGAADLFPLGGWLDVLTGWRGKVDKIFEKMDLLLEEMINEKLRIFERDGRREEDFLDVLLHLYTKEDNESPCTEQIKAILVDMFIGAIDTSVATVVWGMTNLMKNPSYLNKVQEEVRQAVGSKGKVEVSDLQQLHYLKLVIKETLRINPPVPLLPPRESMKDTKINGYDIPAKTMVYVNAWSIGRDPKYWDDPEVFMPERFENSLTNFKGSHFQLIPFGGGRRTCPGLALGMAGIELCFANILYAFDWDFSNGFTKEDLDMGAASGMVSSKKVPLILVARPTLI